MRLEVRDEPGVIAQIAKILGDEQVSIASMIQRGQTQWSVPLMMTLHRAKEARVTAALAKIEDLPAVLKKPCLIRIERL